MNNTNTHALYIDLEYSCWDGPPPSGRDFEIGAAEVDLASLAITKEAAYLVSQTSEIENNVAVYLFTWIESFYLHEAGAEIRINLKGLCT